MKYVVYVSNYIIPFVMFYIILYGFLHKTDVYESFLKGVSDGIQTVIHITPTMIALFVSVGIVRDSGALEWICNIFEPAGRLMHIPTEIIPVFIVRVFSSSAAVSFVMDIFKNYGPDSKTGLIVSIMMSCTETIFYTITIYYMSIKIKKTRWTLPGALCATICGTIASIVIAGFLM